MRKHRRTDAATRMCFRRIIIASVVSYLVLLFALLGFFIVNTESRNNQLVFSPEDLRDFRGSNFNSTIVVITPTYRRITRLADMTRLAQTLMHIRNIVWLVVEDGNEKSLPVQRILERSGLTFRYWADRKSTNLKSRLLPVRGWFARNVALHYLRRQAAVFPHDTVVYFADDDNTYDIRLFSEYISKVQTVGVWAVGIVAEQVLEAPKVENGKLVGWLTDYAPHRPWAVDMAGFAVNLELLIKFPDANFDCRSASPEPCLLGRLNITKEDVQPFGFDRNPKEVLVWHTRTVVEKLKSQKTYGYEVEMSPV